MRVRDGMTRFIGVILLAPMPHGTPGTPGTPGTDGTHGTHGTHGTQEVSSRNALQTLWPNGLGRVGNRVWDVGDGGLDWERGRGIACIARSRGRAGMQLLRHRMGL